MTTLRDFRRTRGLEDDEEGLADPDRCLTLELNILEEVAEAGAVDRGVVNAGVPDIGENAGESSRAESGKLTVEAGDVAALVGDEEREEEARERSDGSATSERASAMAAV